MLTINELNKAFSSLTSFLMNYGYNSFGFQETNGVWELLYENDAVKRNLKVCLFKQQSMFLVSIGNNGKGFHLLDYCQHKGLTRETKTLNSKNNAKGPISKADFENICTSVVDILQNHLKEIVVGKSWEQIPFDFGDYK
jgi:hypothetical protein